MMIARLNVRKTGSVRCEIDGFGFFKRRLLEYPTGKIPVRDELGLESLPIGFMLFALGSFVIMTAARFRYDVSSD